MQKFLFKYCRLVALVLSIAYVGDAQALSCGVNDIRFGSAAYINSIRSYLGSADAVFVGTVEKLSEPILTHYTGTMHLARVRIEKIIKGDLGSHVGVYVYADPAERDGALFYAYRESNELMQSRLDVNKFNAVEAAHLPTPQLYATGVCASLSYPIKSKEAKLHLRTVDRLLRRQAFGSMYVQVAVHNVSSWAEPYNRQLSIGLKPEHYNAHITLTRNGKTIQHQANKAGEATFNNLAAGQYKISVPAIPNYRIKCVGVGVHNCDAINVTAGALQAMAIVFEPEPTVTIKLSSMAFTQPLSTLPLLANFRVQYLGASGVEASRPQQFYPPKLSYFITGAHRLRDDMAQNQIALPPGKYVLELMLHEAESGRRMTVEELYKRELGLVPKTIAHLRQEFEVTAGEKVVEVKLPAALTPRRITLKYDPSILPTGNFRRNAGMYFSAALRPAETMHQSMFDAEHQLQKTLESGSQTYYAIPGQLQFFSWRKGEPLYKAEALVYVERDVEVVLKPDESAK